MLRTKFVESDIFCFISIFSFNEIITFFSNWRRVKPFIRLEILTIDTELQLQTFLVRLSEWNVAAMLKVAAPVTDFLTLNVSTTLAYVSQALSTTMEYVKQV